VVGLLAAFAAGCGGGASPDPSGRNARLAAVIKGLDNPFFVTMRDGLVATARQHRAGMTVAAAPGAQDTAGQASAMESLAGRQAACYVVNPIDGSDLIQPLAHVAKGTPIVNVDSPVDKQAAGAVGVRITTYIGTDNAAAGRLAADAMARRVSRGATVAVLTGVPGDFGSDVRAAGFTQGARGRFNVMQPIAADYDRQRAKLAAADLIRGSQGVRAFFAVNDQMALGIADAVRAAGRGGQVVVIGMDGTQEALAAVSSGAMSATVAQYPYTMGQLAVEACLAAIRGKALPGNIAAPTQLVTRQNVGRARANFPRPVEPFDDPLTRLLNG
jgi:ABC-type sugar transport system substrate-binding protein